MSAGLPSEHALALTSRRRDRRQGIGDLLMTMARVVSERVDPLIVRDMFEELVRRMVPVRSVRLRDGHSRLAGRSDPSNGAEAIALEIAGVDTGTRGVLEARFDAPSALGEWDFHMLGLASHVGSLVLEIERCRGHIARSGGLAVRQRRDGAAPLIGTTPAMQALRSTVERVAETEFTVLLEGESGVGKELVARQIHELSRRRDGPFVALNCAALVETLLEAELFGIEERTATGVRGRRGKFEHADGGTLFLDEVSDLSMAAQAKLLRAIQDLAVERVGGVGTHRVDIRIVAATNRPLRDLVDRKLFRPDLFYRLSGVDVRVPPLRERRADILELARYFLDRHRSTRPLRLSTGAADALVAYSWPGNVRELERLIERAVALTETDTIALDDLPPVVRGEGAVALGQALENRDTMEMWMGRYARLVLEQASGNKRQACRVLDISYHTLNTYLRYQVDGRARGEPLRSEDARLAAEESPAYDAEQVTRITSGERTD
jgi:DNA-binding NtrC family response regulator